MRYQNGRLPDSLLVAIPARHYAHSDTARLIAAAAAAFMRVAAAFECEFGKPLVGVSFYRPIERQIEIFKKNYRRVSRPRSKSSDRTFGGATWEKYRGANVASPGYSNHGLGLAVDMHSGVETIGSPEHDWMTSTGRTYGWDWDEGRRNGEGWHMRYNATLDRHKHDKALAAGTVTAASAAASTRVAATRDLQAALTDLGYDPGPVDGQDGTKTRAAVRAYQAATGLSADGVAGSTTRSRMEADMAKLDDIQKTLARHSQILEALDVRTGNSQSGRLAQAADRILGILPQRYGADKKPARILDTLDGDTLRQDIRDAVRQIKGA